MFDYSKWNMNNRIKNMVYNTSENYGVGVNIAGHNSYTDTKNVNVGDLEVLLQAGVKQKDAEEQSLYAAAHEGAHVRLSDITAMTKMMKDAVAKGANLEILNGLAQVTEDYRVDWQTTKTRPGYNDLRNGSTRAFIKLFGKEPSGKTNFDITKAISAYTYDTDMRQFDAKWKDLDWDMIENVANTIMDEAKTAKSTSDTMEIAERLYNKYFKSKKSSDKDDGEGGDKGQQKQEQQKQDDNKSLGEGLPQNNKGTGKGKRGKSDDEDDEDDDNFEDEDDGDNDSGDEEGEENDTPSDKEIEELVIGGLNSSTMAKVASEHGDKEISMAKTKAQAQMNYNNSYGRGVESDKNDAVNRFGRCLWTKEEWKRIERELCRDAHAGAGLVYVKAQNRCRSNAELSKRDAVIQEITGHARQLADRFKEDMRAAKNEDGYVADNGNIIPTKAYRATHINDNHVFYKPMYTEEGGYVVDLVIDGSGSQDFRMNMIRRQAYIIATACSLANIPCRVSAFCFHGDCVSLTEVFRDFDDDANENKGVFNYAPKGSNRDGLSILVAYDGLKQRREEKKIMIVLSDGYPAGSSRNIGRLGGMGSYESYDHKWNGIETSGVKDTAKIVRKIRSEGVALMGVYVGDHDALDSEKIMYGNDFAYIGTDMKIFVPKVAEYMHKQILSLQ